MPAAEVSVPMEVALEIEVMAVSDPRMAEFDFAPVSKCSLSVEDAVEKLVLVPIVAVAGTGMALVPNDLWDAALMLWAGVVLGSVETTVLELGFVVGSMHLQMVVRAIAVWLERPKVVGSEVEPKEDVAVAEGVTPKMAETLGIVVAGPKMAVRDLDFVARH